MNGKDLYELWLTTLLDVQNCGADPWDELSDEDKEVWSRMAERVEFI